MIYILHRVILISQEVENIANIAYVRVSTVEQNDERQREALAACQIDKWFCEKVSGKDIKLRTAQIFNAPAQPNPELTARGMLMPEASAAKILIETE